MSSAPISRNQPAPAKGWFSRNWKWFVPTIVLTLILLFAAFVGGILTLVFGAMKNSDAYKHAVTVATHDPQVIRELGDPIEPGFLVSGSISVSGPSGEAKLSIPLKGRIHNGTVFVEATKSAGLWNYQILVVEIEGTPQRIDLLHPTLLHPSER